MQFGRRRVVSDNEAIHRLIAQIDQIDDWQNATPRWIWAAAMAVIPSGLFVIMFALRMAE